MRTSWGEAQVGAVATVFHPGFLDSPDPYGFRPRLCERIGQQTKGKVERLIRYLRTFYCVVSGWAGGLNSRPRDREPDGGRWLRRWRTSGDGHGEIPANGWRGESCSCSRAKPYGGRSVRSRPKPSQARITRHAEQLSFYDAFCAWRR